MDIHLVGILLLFLPLDLKASDLDPVIAIDFGTTYTRSVNP